jgi:hypothetical protein
MMMRKAIEKVLNVLIFLALGITLGYLGAISLTGV